MSTVRGERRKGPRRSSSLYLRFVNQRTGETVGDLDDISSQGFRLECNQPIKLGTEITFRVEVPVDIISRGFIALGGRAIWTAPDKMDGRLHDVGFLIISIDANDRRALEQIIQRYSRHRAGLPWE